METKMTMLKEFKAMEAKKTAAKATMPKKAKTYRKVIRISFIIACITATTTLTCATISYLINQSFFTPFTISIGVIMALSLIILIASIIAKKIWEWKLLKIGLMLPPELD